MEIHRLVELSYFSKIEGTRGRDDKRRETHNEGMFCTQNGIPKCSTSLLIRSVVRILGTY